MKKKLIVFAVLALAAILIGAAFWYKQTEANLDSLLAIEIPEVDMSEIEDGIYNGSYDVFPVSAVVRVTAQNHEITDIQLLEHVNGQGAPAEVITDSVIESQSLQVDSVTGATFSSKVIILAIHNALKGA